ncbi:hypothetical protein M409DRAFT_37398 [Zasmidium cellare ATCC 36951]|uniref:Serine peptidase n=1 Tax=Zasmidium cellare ATCC 36951 TaxID=1080233 RepID=A0A6A6C895_ZASCE|nr:uncharacterized protein M409DRAFT_37398 [Zasmidium cellare ATCC 36951]KAF2162460.1 hypothetical protein M409DRAFT_37398 [Zasmidium cellare ATCC 36951]
MNWLWTCSVALLALETAQAQHWRGNGFGWGWQLPGRNIKPPVGIKQGFFTQVLDHKNPGLGTFRQRYWYDTQYWKGPGSPVVFLNAGEVDASGYTGYCTNETITGLIAQEIGAATIVFEHRYWGESSPFSELTTANLTYLTLENSIQDMIHFAQNVRLPFAWHTNAADVPWILVGGSYPGALAAYTASVAPGTFWAYLASSAPVQVISDFWQYFAPVQAGMPTNCSADVAKVIDYMDNVMEHGSESQIQDLKNKFGLGELQHNDDFMTTLENGPWLWQANSDLSISGFWDWCDYVENSVNASGSSLPGPEGVGLEKALDGYAAWLRSYIPGSCASYGYFQGDENTDCYDSYDASSPIFTDLSVNNTASRQWTWILCNQPFGFWQDGAPEGRPSPVSRLSTPAYWIRQCGLYFPTGPQGQTYGINKGATQAEVNAYTGGWEITNTTRLVYTNGEFDPWRSGSVSSTFRPGGPLASTPQVPINLIPGGVHCYDLLAASGQANAAIEQVQRAEVAQMMKWVAEWP